MHRRQPLPRLWLVTDERQGVRLLDAVGRLPDGSGILFRHYSLPSAARRRLFDQVASLAKPRGLTLLLAGSGEDAALWGADGSHGRGPAEGLRSAPAHDLDEIRAAEAAGADLIFLSPVFPTASHPGAPVLGPQGFDALAAQTRVPVIALGGMDATNFAALNRAYGWAAIDALTRA